MFSHNKNRETLDELIKRHEREAERIKQDSEKLCREKEELLRKLGLNMDDMHSYFDKKSTLSAEEWRFVQKQIAELEERHKRELANLPDPEKNKKVFAERNIPPTWLFVK